MPDDQDDRLQGSKTKDWGLRFWVGIVALIGAVIFWLILSGCTFIGFNRGPVTTTADDSHDAHGTNGAHTFDVNISPR